MSSIMSEYGGLLLVMLGVLAMFLIYWLILDKGKLYITYYNVSPYSEYNEVMDSDSVFIGQYGVIGASEMNGSFIIGNSSYGKAPSFQVDSAKGKTVIPVVDKDKKVVEFSEADIKKYFIDDYGIDISVNGEAKSLSLDDLLIVEYRPQTETITAPDGATYRGSLKYEWGYCLDEYGNRIRSEDSSTAVVKDFGNELVDDDFDLDVVTDADGYLMIPVPKYDKYLWVSQVNYTGKGGDSLIAESREDYMNGTYTGGGTFDDFELVQDQAVRYKAVYRTVQNGMKAQHVAIFRNTTLAPSSMYD